MRWQALVPYALGAVTAWVSNEYGIAITPLNGILVARVLAWELGVRAR